MGMLSKFFGGDAIATETRRNSIENPRISLNDPRAWDELFGLNLSDTGVRVTPNVALGYPPLWRGVSLIANTVAKLPLRVYKQISETEVEKDRKHSAYWLVHWRANEYLTAFEFKRLLTYHALFRGNGFAAIFRDAATDKPIELLPLSPTSTGMVRDGGQVWYVTEIGSERRRLAARDVLHIHGLSYDGLMGHDVITVMADALGLGIAARKFGAKFFANGANAGGVLMLPRGMSDQAQKRLRKDWKTFQEGLDNSFRTAVLEDGAKWTATTINPEQSQLMALRQFEVREVANILGLPPHKLGDDSRLAYNSLEQENKAVLEDCYDPWLKKWEDECDAKLLSDEDRGYGRFRGQGFTEWRRYGNFFEFDRSQLQRPDERAQAEIDDKRVNTGLMTLNEVRSRNNLPPLPPEIGDELRIPTTVTLGPPQEPEAAEPGEDTAAPKAPLAEPDDAPEGAQSMVPLVAVNAALERLLANNLARLADIEHEQISKAAARGGDFVGWSDRWLSEHERRVSRGVDPIWRTIAEASGRAHDAAACEQSARAYVDALRSQLLAACEVPADKLVDSVAATMTGEPIAQARSRIVQEAFRC